MNELILTLLFKEVFMHVLKILSADYIAHNVKRFVVEKPEGLVYRPGQSTYLSINKPGWEEIKRPFTFTSLNDWPYLEFIVKIRSEERRVGKECKTWRT